MGEILSHKSPPPGAAPAALSVNTIWRLVRFRACLFTAHLAVVPFGTWAGLVLSLAVSVVWNLVLYGLRRRALLRGGAGVIQS